MSSTVPDIEEIHIDETIDVIGRDKRFKEGPCVRRVCFTPIGTVCLRGRWMDVYDFIRKQPDYNPYIYHLVMYVYGSVRSFRSLGKTSKRFVDCHTPTACHPSTFHLEHPYHRWVLMCHNRTGGQNIVEPIKTYETLPLTYIQELDAYQPQNGRVSPKEGNDRG